MSWLNLPTWLPWWVPLLVAVPLGLWLLCLIIMPFSVIGVKSRLESIEAELEELHTELRTLVLRLPEAGRLSYAAEPHRAGPTRAEPPVEPMARPTAAPEPPRPFRDPPAPRAEPRLDWRQH